MLRGDDALLWWQKRRWYERERRPWRRARLQLELARRRAYARMPLHGNVLDMLSDGRLRLGEHVHLEPHVWLTGGPEATLEIGPGTMLNLCVQVSALRSVEIGAHCMFANGCFVSDAEHAFGDPETPVPWQGFESRGPTRIADNVWCGANVVVTGGVTVGERCVVGANSVVTKDLPPRTVCAGAPARVLRAIEYPAPGPGRNA